MKEQITYDIFDKVDIRIGAPIQDASSSKVNAKLISLSKLDFEKIGA